MPDEIATVVHHDVADDEHAAIVRRRVMLLQIRERAPVRRHIVKITTRVTVELAAAIHHDG